MFFKDKCICNKSITRGDGKPQVWNDGYLVGVGRKEGARAVGGQRRWPFGTEGIVRR